MTESGRLGVAFWSTLCTSALIGATAMAAATDKVRIAGWILGAIFGGFAGIYVGAYAESRYRQGEGVILLIVLMTGAFVWALSQWDFDSSSTISSAPEIAPQTPALETVVPPAPKLGRFAIDKCDYYFGDVTAPDFSPRGYRFAVNGKVVNLSQDGHLLRLIATWSQNGRIPVRYADESYLPPRREKTIRVRLPASQRQIDRYDFSLDCNVKIKVLAVAPEGDRSQELLSSAPVSYERTRLWQFGFPSGGTIDDVDCADVGNEVIVGGSDPDGLDADGDGIGCEGM